MSEHGPSRKSPPRLAPRPSILQHVPQKTIKKTKTRISNACTACKARKTKCDNNKPKCTACTARPNSECVYFPFLDKRKRQQATTNRDVKSREHELLTKIFNATKYCSKEELPSLLELIRGDASIEQIAQYIQDTLEDSNPTGLETDPLDSPSVDDEIDEAEEIEEQENEPLLSPLAIQFSHRRRSKTIDAMDIGSIVQISIPDVPSQPWTSVTTNDEFVSHLIQLYFTWETPVYDLVEKSLFIPDMRSGDLTASRYCSPLLVNSMLAAACRNSDRDASVEDENDPKSCGNQFFTEAERLWQNGPKSTSLTNMQALVIMHFFEVHRANDGVGLGYLSTALDMYQELVSQDYRSADMTEPLLQISWPCWKFWICRCFTSLVLRQPYQIPLPSLPEPWIPDQVDLSDTWQPYPQLTRSRPFRKMDMMHQCIELAKLVQEASVYLYSNESVNPEVGGIIEIHGKLELWYDGYLSTTNGRDNHIGPDMTMRIWYHALKMHLCRGFITKAAPVCPETTEMITVALDTVCQSAKLQRKYFQLYGAKGTILLIYNSYLSSLFALYFLEFPRYREAFIEHVKMLSRLAVRRGMAAFQLYTVKSYAALEGIELPEDVLELFDELEASRDIFEKRLSTIPVPALSFEAPALRNFKEGLIDREEAGSSSTANNQTVQLAIGTRQKGKEKSSTGSFDEIDPIIGGLSDFYLKMLTLEQRAE